MPRLLPALALLTLFASPAWAGTITGLSLSPAEAAVGATIRATATGSGPCGAVHIDWGDGNAITYATATLPVTQTHVYQAAGAFTVRAQGMGNCDGQATARVTIKGAPGGSRLAAIELEPARAPVRTPVVITLRGTGACQIAMDYGDGNTQNLAGELPMVVRHTYAVPRRYTIVATPMSPCAERRTAVLDVADAPQAGATLTGVEISTVPGREASSTLRGIRVMGRGQCAFTIDYGDGNSETRTAPLPDLLQHNYPAGGRYEVVVRASAPCSGTARATTSVPGNTGSDAGATVTRVDVRPLASTPDRPVTVTVLGSGTCRFTVDLGDGESRVLTEALPYRFAYRYPRPGTFEVFVWTDPPCQGEGSARVRIRRR